MIQFVEFLTAPVFATSEDLDLIQPAEAERLLPIVTGNNRPVAVLHDNQVLLARSSDLLERIHLDSINGTGLSSWLNGLHAHPLL